MVETAVRLTDLTQRLNMSRLDDHLDERAARLSRYCAEVPPPAPSTPLQIEVIRPLCPACDVRMHTVVSGTDGQVMSLVHIPGCNCLKASVNPDGFRLRMDEEAMWVLGQSGGPVLAWGREDEESPWMRL
jgi:hypothetical protein